MDIQNAALAGAHIIATPPQFQPKMVDNRYTREAVRQVNCDAEKVLEQFAHAHERGRGWEVVEACPRSLRAVKLAGLGA